MYYRTPFYCARELSELDIVLAGVESRGCVVLLVLSAQRCTRSPTGSRAYPRSSCPSPCCLPRRAHSCARRPDAAIASRARSCASARLRVHLTRSSVSTLHLSHSTTDSPGPGRALAPAVVMQICFLCCRCARRSQACPCCMIQCARSWPAASAPCAIGAVEAEGQRYAAPPLLLSSLCTSGATCLPSRACAVARRREREAPRARTRTGAAWGSFCWLQCNERCPSGRNQEDFPR